MADQADQAAKVAQYWGDERRELRKHNWLEHPVARACINVRLSGDATVGLAEYWRAKFLTVPARRALSLGCGFGLWERMALAANLALHIDAYDVSEAAITQARAYAAEAGYAERVTYHVADINSIALPHSHYDVIFGVSSLHHVRGLEHLFAGCRRALKENGLFLIDEYVGPARFQSSPKAVALINKLIQVLPPRYRTSVYHNGQPRETYANIPPDVLAAHDPSEAIRSDEILPVLRQHFEVVDYRPYGGALLHMLLSGTAGNFDPHAEADAALIRLLAAFEEEMEQAGVIGTDFAVVAARPLPG